jgi:hypothetical protein
LDVAVVVVSGFAEVPPKKNHALKRIIAVGINILNKILFTILYWKLRADDIFTILLYNNTGHFIFLKHNI